VVGLMELTTVGTLRERGCFQRVMGSAVLGMRPRMSHSDNHRNRKLPWDYTR
jgi:hypothetical protein